MIYVFLPVPHIFVGPDEFEIQPMNEVFYISFRSCDLKTCEKLKISVIGILRKLCAQMGKSGTNIINGNSLDIFQLLYDSKAESVFS